MWRTRSSRVPCTSRMRAFACTKSLSSPARLFHYSNVLDRRRIAHVLLVADDGYVMGPVNQKHICGEHGYNNSLLDMHTVFTGIGPRFARGRS